MADRSTLAVWGTYLLGVLLVVVASLVTLGAWVAIDNPSTVALGVAALVILLGLNVFARRLGVAR